jgi:hypothetical protein
LQLHHISSQYAFPLYGFLWFTMGDFLPRGASTIALAFLMRQSNTDAVIIEKRKVDFVAVVIVGGGDVFVDILVNLY